MIIFAEQLSQSPLIMTPERLAQKINYCHVHNLMCRPSMKRRKPGHDYQGVCIYMITLIIQDRKPLLGELFYDSDSLFRENQNAYVKYSLFGRKVKRIWNKIPFLYPQIQTWRCEIMPDHIHGILYVKERLPIHLSEVITGFKSEVRELFREIMPEEYKSYLAWKENHAEQIKLKEIEDKGCVFELGYCDSILSGQGQLNKWFDYLRNNPLRLAVKRAFPDLFRVKRSLIIGGREYDSIGNRFLAQQPWKEQVRLSRSLSDAEIDEKINTFMAKATEGAVLVSPAISKGEKAVMRAALDSGYSCIYIASYGFNNFTKVNKEFMESCAEGRLLMISDIEYSNTPTFNREVCNRLNDLAKEIADLGSKFL